MKLFFKPITLDSILFILLLITASSCNDWIDVEPENKLIKQEFWKTTDDLMAVVASTYDALRDQAEKSFKLGEIRADFYTDLSDVSHNLITSGSDMAKWDEYYKTINLANTVMYYAPIVQKEDKTLTDRMVEGITAEMLFIRSLSYFYLVRCWKEVPLVLNPTISDTVNFYLPQSRENVVLSHLVKDLEKASAIAYTNEYQWELEKYKGRANKYAIQALLADILLWSENYSKCIVYCDSLINTGLFSLESKDTWFNLYYPGNSRIESLFELQYNDQLEGQENKADFIKGLMQHLPEMGFDDIDMRKCNSIGPKNKYFGKDAGAITSRRAGEYDAHIIYYRYADILLMKAEALAELGSFDDANILLQQIAERAGTTHTPTYSISDFRITLLNQRGKEFACEGKRWFDVLRFAKKNHFEDTEYLKTMLLGKAKDATELAIMRTKVIDTMGYYLPIYQGEIDNNRNLVQNPFYDR
jgi:hypothetical protein